MQFSKCYYLKLVLFYLLPMGLPLCFLQTGYFKLIGASFSCSGRKHRRFDYLLRQFGLWLREFFELFFDDFQAVIGSR
jgi:hypothetical protein